MTDPARSLSEQLGGALPPGIEALDDEQRRMLAEALRDARRRQSAALARASDEALRYVPAFLRGTVRKVVGL